MFKRFFLKHPTAPNLYQYGRGRVLTNGVQSWAFDAAFQNPVYSFRGNARLAGAMVGNPRPLFLGQRAPIASIGGLQAGFKYMQPLSNDGSPFGD